MMKDGADVRRPQRGRPTREISQALTDQLLNVATKLFLAHGYSSTSFRKIADEAQITRHTLYSRFATKRDLFEAIISRKAILPPDLQAIGGLPDDNPLIQLRRLCEETVAWASNDEWVALYRTTIAEVSRFPELPAMLARHALDPLLERYEVLIRMAHDLSLLFAPDPMFLAIQLHNSMSGVVLSRALAGPDYALDEEARSAFVDKCWALFLNATRST